MGYTLLQLAPTGPDLYRRVLAENGHTVTREELDAAVLPARDFYIRATREGRPFESSMELATQFWEEYNTLVLEGLRMPVDIHASLGERIYTEAWSPKAWRPFADVLPTLDQLRRQGIRMAVVSNFVDTLAAVCDHNGLTQYFDVILPSVEAGAMKPDPRIFEIALRRLGVAAEDAWHVGDNYWTDILGARAVGITGVLVDRERSVPHPDGPVLHTFDQLLSLLSEAEAEAA